MQHTYKLQSLLLSLSFLMFLSACGGKTHISDRVALGTIADYAYNSTNKKPKLQDYKDADIQGVTAQNIEALNVYIEQLDREEVDTFEELQAVVNLFLQNENTTVDTNSTIVPDTNSTVDTNTTVDSNTATDSNSSTVADSNSSVDSNSTQTTDTNVTVPPEADTTAPVITLLGANPQIIAEDSNYTELGAIAQDAVDGNLTSSIVIDASAVNTAVPGDYVVNYTVQDASGNTAQITRTVTITPDKIRVALESADASDVSEAELYQAIADTYSAQLQQCTTFLNTIYPNGLVQKDAVGINNMSIIRPKSNGWMPLMVAANNGSEEFYMYAKEFANGTRVVVTSMPIFDEMDMKSNYNDGKDKSEILNILKWLAGTKGANSNGTLKSDADFLNTSLLLEWNDESVGWSYGGGWNKLWEVQKWIGANFSTLGVTLQANGLPQNWSSTKHNANPTLTNDIYMTVRADDSYIETLMDAAQNGTPKGILLLLPRRGYINGYNNTLGFFQSWDTATQKAYGDMPSIEAQCRLSLEGEIATLIEDLKNENFHYTFPDVDASRHQFDRWNIALSGGNGQLRDYTDANDNQSINKKLFLKLDKLRDLAYHIDDKKIDIFADQNETTQRLQKLFFLLGDKYRADINYPMDKVDTPNSTFFKALFADNTISYMRTSNHLQPNMGTFLNHDQNTTRYMDNTAIHAKQTGDKNVTFTTSKFDDATAAGVYAPPGKMVTIKREDSSSVEVWVRVNFTRGGTGGSTGAKWFAVNYDGYADNSMPFSEKNLYNRPQAVSSRWMPIATGETLHISTPYGGPLYVQWKGQSVNPKPQITLHFSNILEHPVLDLDGSETAQQKTQEINDFVNALNQDGFSWADIKTPFAQMHTLVENMLGVVNNATYNGSVEKYIEYLNKYLILGNYHWAGFNGGGLAPLNPSVVDFCQTKNLNCTDPVIHQKPPIQHMNSDAKALCGNACAGNPIDFDHGIDPIAQLPNHEMGHNLQTALVKVPNGDEISNLISTFYTARQVALDNNESHFSGWGQIRVEFVKVFNRIKDMDANGVIAVDNKAPLDDHFSGVAFYEQLLWSSDDNESVAWDFYTKMWLHERLFRDALKDANSWTNERTKLGFGTYTHAEAQTLKSIDYLAIVASYITDKDYSDFFDMWRLKVSQKAKTQITANNPASVYSRAFLYIEQGNGLWANHPAWEGVFMVPTHHDNSNWIDMSVTSTLNYTDPTP